MSEVSLWFYSLGGEYMAKVLKAIKVLFVFFTKDEAAASGEKGSRPPRSGVSIE